MKRFFQLFFSVVLCLTEARGTLIPATYLGPAGSYTPNGSNGIGVPGGIPNRTDAINVSIADFNDTATNTTVIQAAVDAANGTSKVVVLPAGVIKCYGISMSASGPGYNNLTIRGQGTGVGGTTLKVLSNTGIAIGTGVQWKDPGSLTTTVNRATLTKGATSFTVANGSSFATSYRMFKMYLPSDPSLPFVDVYGEDPSKRSMTFIMGSRSGNTFNIQPAIPEDLTGLPSDPVIYCPSAYTICGGIGIEDMVISGATAAEIDPGGLTPMKYGINVVGFAYSCWVKNVNIFNARAASAKTMSIVDAVQCEVRHSWIGGNTSVGSNLSGLLYEGTTNLWVEDCIGEDNQPVFEGWISNLGAVFSYNYVPRATNALAFVTNHNTHNSYTILEGNIMPTDSSDGYYGGESRKIDFRNWITAVNDGTQNYGTNQARFTRYFAGIGNILYAPGFTWSGAYLTAPVGWNLGLPYGGSRTGGNAQLSASQPWGDWDTAAGRPKLFSAHMQTITLDGSGHPTLGTFTLNDSSQGDDFELQTSRALGNSRIRSISSGTRELTIGTRSGNTWPFSNASNTLPTVGSNFNLVAGPNGFPEIDLDVAATSILKGNYDYGTNTQSTLSGDTLTDSLIHASKPAFFGNIDFPPFVPTAGNVPTAYDAANFARIPAGWRYVYGNEDYMNVVSTPQFSPVGAVYSGSQVITITTATSGATIRYRTDGIAPTPSTGTIYTAGVIITSNTTLKAIAYKGGLSDSVVITGVYVINPASGNVYQPGPIQILRR